MIAFTCLVVKITICYLIEFQFIVSKSDMIYSSDSRTSQVSKHTGWSVWFLCRCREKQSYLEKAIFENKTIDSRFVLSMGKRIVFFLQVVHSKTSMGARNHDMI